MIFHDLLGEVMTQRERDGVRGRDRELSRVRCHIAPAAFAPKDVAAIGSPDIREWLRWMADRDAKGPGEPRKLSRQTISRCQSLVSAVFIEAVERELIPVNPCLGVKPKKRVDERDTVDKWSFLTPAEQVAFKSCAAIPYEDRLCVRVAIATGMRQGEHRHLELPDMIVEGDEPRVVIRYAGRTKDGRKLPPKSGKRRIVPLFGDGLVAAREWLDRLPSYCPSNPEALAFPSASGKLRQQGKFLGRSDTLRCHYRTAGIRLRPHLHWHALRHTFATNLIAGTLGRAWRLEEVQVAMGHSSYAVTQRYAHLGEDAILKAARETAAAIALSVPLAADTIRDLNAAFEAEEAVA